MIDQGTFKLIVYSMLTGVTVAVLYTYYVKAVLGAFVRKLIEIDASTVESAMTLKELGCDKKFLIKFTLQSSKHFKETVHSTETEPPKYYLPVEVREIAVAKYKDDGSTLWQVLLTVLLFIIIILVCTWVLPSVTDIFV